MNNIDLISQKLSLENDKDRFFDQIVKEAKQSGIFPSSIYPYYQKFAEGKLSGFTVPAINLKTMTFDIARLIFQLAKEYQIGLFIFELARSEMNYTNQTPKEFSGLILAAALRENYQGPVFIQGDHFQFNSEVYQINPNQEIKSIKKLIKSSIEAGFFNIDIDASTLVDLNRSNLDEQQKENYINTALLSQYIRELEPPNITITIGGEIGHIGGKNSTVADFEAFMHGYLEEIKDKKIKGLSKISIQTGTSHGGIPLPDGKLEKVKVDFRIIKEIGEVARKKYGLGGVVQHGASTLPEELFAFFPMVNTLEIHLGTEFLNLIFDHLPHHLKKEMYRWIVNNLKHEWKEEWTEDQFIYKTRKKSLGHFKEKLILLSEDEKKPIMNALKQKIKKIFEKLNIFYTKNKLNNIELPKSP